MYQPTVNATLMNVDLLALYKTAAGININLPEFTVWRIRIKVSVSFTIAAAVAANDAILLSVFTDSATQVPVNQVANPLDQRDLIFTPWYVSEAVSQGVNAGAGTFVLFKEFDIKAHRRIRQGNDTLYLQLATSGQPQMTGVSIGQIILMRE